MVGPASASMGEIDNEKAGVGRSVVACLRSVVWCGLIFYRSRSESRLSHKLYDGSRLTFFAVEREASKLPLR